jgi:hypothetical protein
MSASLFPERIILILILVVAAAECFSENVIHVIFLVVAILRVVESVHIGMRLGRKDKRLFCIRLQQDTITADVVLRQNGRKVLFHFGVVVVAVVAVVVLLFLCQGVERRVGITATGMILLWLQSS